MKKNARRETVEADPKRMNRYRRRIALLLCATVLFAGLSAALISGNEDSIGGFRTQEGRAVYQAAYAEAMNLLPKPTRTYDIETAFGIVRAYEWSGAGHAARTPVILIPGHSSGAPMWYANLGELAASRTVYAFDPLGDAGMSVNTVPLRDTKDQAQYIDEALEKLGVGKAHIVGHSFGGAAAAAVAVYKPQRVASLSLIEPVFTLSAPPASVLLWAIPASLPFLPEAWRNQAMLNMVGEEASDADAAFDDPVARMIAAAAEHYSDALPTPGVLTDEELTQLTMPVYVALAEKSLSGSDAAQRAALMPNAQAEVWAGTTHSLPMEVSQELDARLEALWAAMDGE